MQIPQEWNAILERMPALKEEFSEQQAENAGQLFPDFFLHAFRPNGEGLAEFLTPFPSGEALLARFDALYRLTAENTSQMYFVPPEKPMPDEETLAQMAAAFVKGQTQLMQAFGMEDEAELNPAPKIQMMEQAEFTARISETLAVDESILEEFSDLFYALKKKDSNLLLRLHSEPLYMIACDYMLAYYFIWPLAAQALHLEGEDPLLPYYAFWQYGLRPELYDENTVWLVKQ